VSVIGSGERMPFSHRQDVIEPQVLAALTKIFEGVSTALTQDGIVFNRENLADTIFNISRDSRLSVGQIRKAAEKTFRAR
jgi:hypothetical protein